MKKDDIINSLANAINNDSFNIINTTTAYSVLILLRSVGSDFEVLFEKRSSFISQPGEISFPGGKIEPNETPLFAALRETEEETGIKKEDISSIIEIPPLILMDRILIIPFVAFLDDEFDVNRLANFSNREVEFCFFQSISRLKLSIPLTGDMSYEVNLKDGFPINLLPYEDYSWTLGYRTVYFYPLDNGELLWGLSAQILNWILDKI